jgi:AraC family transcriptional regulator
MKWTDTSREPSGSLKNGDVEIACLHLERWHFEPGHFEPHLFDCNEIGYVISGRTHTWLATPGVTQHYFIEPGTCRIAPAGVYESDAGITEPVDVLYARLPPDLLAQSVLADYGIDPTKIELTYAGGLKDPVLSQIMQALHDSMSRGDEPADHLFAGGMQAALTGHLLRKYTIDRWTPPSVAPDLDPRRLRRVLDMIEARYREPLSLTELAAEACLSEFHFSRLFQATTGFSPYRYVTLRRIQSAKRMLAHSSTPLLDIARDTGFGTQANFTRLFRKLTGLTPGQYRVLHKERGA